MWQKLRRLCSVRNYLMWDLSLISGGKSSGSVRAVFVLLSNTRAHARVNLKQLPYIHNMLLFVFYNIMSSTDNYYFADNTSVINVIIEIILNFLGKRGGTSSLFSITSNTLSLVIPHSVLA